MQTRLRRFAQIPALSLLVLLLFVPMLPGCGGGGDDDDATRIAGFLDSGSNYDPGNDIYFDLYEFRGRRDGNVTVRSTSDDFETILGVENLDSGFEDSDNGGGDDSQLNFQVENNDRYLVAVGSNDGAFGNYDLEVGDRLEFSSNRRVKASELPAGLKAKFGAFRAAYKSSNPKP